MPDVHKTLVRTATGCLPSLAVAMKAAGPVKMSTRSDMPLALYLCRSVVGQQLSGKAAGTIWGRVEAYCQQRKLDLGKVIAREGNEWLRACGVSGSKSRAIASIFEAEAAGLLDAATLAGVDHPERSSRVGSIWGIGQWTCDMLSMFYFGEQDVWPRADSAANRVLASFMARDGLAGEAWETAQRFSPHRSHLALYMWHIADNGLA